MASIFTRIMRGELPSYKLWEDEHSYAFLAIDQIRPGHTLVVPKIEVDSFLELTDPAYSHVFRIVQKLGRAIKQTMLCPRVGVAIQGFEVAHCHVHVIPLWDATDLDFRKAKRLPSDEMEQIQTKILQALQLS